MSAPLICSARVLHLHYTFYRNQKKGKLKEEKEEEEKCIKKNKKKEKRYTHIQLFL